MATTTRDRDHGRVGDRVRRVGSGTSGSPPRGWIPKPPPPVPRLVVPLQDETRFSYLARVAAANHVPDRAVWERLTMRPPDTDEDPPVRSRWIAALCGIDQQRLLSAVPDLQVGSTGPGGPLPVTGRPLPEPCRPPAAVPVLRRPPRRGPHRERRPGLGRWSRRSGSASRTTSAADTRSGSGPTPTATTSNSTCRALPEVVQAQTRHRRLVRRRGRREVFLAYTDAASIWWKLAWLHDYSTERDQRLHRYTGARHRLGGPRLPRPAAPRSRSIPRPSP